MNKFKIFILLIALPFVYLTCHGGTVLWNTFVISDFSSWKDGAWVLQSGLPYGPGVGFLCDGSVWSEGCFNVDGGGSYWVHSFFGDELSSFSEYSERNLLADVGYSGENVIAGEGVSGGHEYLAIIGYTSNMYDPSAKIETYYGWVELNGKSVVASAITAEGPLRIGTGEVIPEPASSVMLLIGCAVLFLRRETFKSTTLRSSSNASHKKRENGPLSPFSLFPFLVYYCARKQGNKEQHNG